MGALCGYVGVPPSHPFYKKGYDDCDVDVHGGLTFANFCHPSADESHGICHTPENGREAHVWWLGFDCGHYDDYMPALEAETKQAINRALSAFGQEKSTYRNFKWVKKQVEKLAQQIAGKSSDV